MTADSIPGSVDCRLRLSRCDGPLAPDVVGVTSLVQKDGVVVDVSTMVVVPLPLSTGDAETSIVDVTPASGVALGSTGSRSTVEQQPDGGVAWLPGTSMDLSRWSGEAPPTRSHCQRPGSGAMRSKSKFHFLRFSWSMSLSRCTSSDSALARSSSDIGPNKHRRALDDATLDDADADPRLCPPLSKPSTAIRSHTDKWYSDLLIIQVSQLLTTTDSFSSFLLLCYNGVDCLIQKLISNLTSTSIHHSRN